MVFTISPKNSLTIHPRKTTIQPTILTIYLFFLVSQLLTRYFCNQKVLIGIII